MPPLKDLIAAGETTRVCSVPSGCGRELPLIDPESGECAFVIKRANGRNKIDQVTRLCLDCKKRLSREYYEMNAAAVKQRVSNWRKENRAQINAQVRRRRQRDPEWAERIRLRQRRGNMTPEQVERARARQREYVSRPDVRARIQKYRRQYDAILREAGAASMRELREVGRIQKKSATPDQQRIKRALRRYEALALKSRLSHEELDYLRIVAPLPAVAIRPLLVTVLAQCAPHTIDGLSSDQEQLLRRWLKGQYNEGDQLIGVGRLSTISGVPERSIFRMFQADAASMTLDLADRLFMHTDYTLDDLVDIASEWAMLTSDPWPIGYRGVKRILDEMRSNSIAA